MSLPDETTSSETAPVAYESLAAALSAFRIELPDDQIVQLDRYREVLWGWNEKLNLTRHTTLEKFVGRDVIDTMQLAAHIDRGRRVLDIGSGGGVPGVILAICRPDLRVSLCESTQKKAKVLNSIVEELQFPITVHGCRAEELLELQTFDTLVARAVAPMGKLLFWLKPHWDAFDELLMIKGSAWVEERGDARHRGVLHDLELRKAAEYESPAGKSVVLRVWRGD